MAKVLRHTAMYFYNILLIILYFECAKAVDLAKTSALQPSESALKHRQTRDAPTDVKNHYQSVKPNEPSSESIAPPQPNLPQTNAGSASSEGLQTKEAKTATSMSVPYKIGDRTLLGVNGTGQRKDVDDKNALRPTIVSEPIQTGPITSTKFPKKVLTVAQAAVTDESSESLPEEVVANIDVPENETLATIQKQNFTVNQITDHHGFYNSSIYVDPVKCTEIWETVKNIPPNPMLSHSHRRAMTVELSFKFPFYGHPVENITVATGGFLYTGEYVHSWLAATQYIAPLMANFDTSLSNDSFVRLLDNGTAFTVVWENVSLQESSYNETRIGKFSFSATMHKNGDIVFVYYKVPILISAIEDDKHPVKVGLSDAYIIDKIIYFARRKTIYEYHRVNFGSANITNSTIIYLKALPTCLDFTDCQSCLTHNTTFECAWCPLAERCSTGTDRRKQDWIHKGCEKILIDNVSKCPAIGDKGNNVNKSGGSNGGTTTDANKNSEHSTGQTSHPFFPDDHNSAGTSGTIAQALNKGANKAAANDDAEPKNVGLAFGFMLPICLVVTISLWVLYAYRNPHTKSGQLLIQYRPSQWSWRRGEARYTAATIHM